MRRALLISLSFNFLFFALFCRSLLTKSTSPTERRAQGLEVQTTPNLAERRQASLRAQTSQQTSPQAFRWSQIESTDYRTYVANLRAIGCPEQTLRDIIVADVHALFLRQAGKAQNGPAEQLSRAERDLVDALLTGAGQDTPGSLSPSSYPKVVRRIVQDTNAVMPLVFRQAPMAMDLTAEQTAAFSWLRENFEETLGGTNQDPADPEYLSRWQAAQKASDAMMLGLFGQDFVVRYKMSLIEQP